MSWQPRPEIELMHAEEWWRRLRWPFFARWAARAIGLFLFLGWGSFAVAHFFEWFHGHDRWPPAWVFGVYALHLLMLAGFVIAWRWERLGALFTLAASAAFFHYAAGPNALNFTAVNAIPCVLWLLAAWGGPSTAETQTAPA